MNPTESHELDLDILEEVLCRLCWRDVCSATMVSRDWKSCCDRESLWRRLLFSNPNPMLRRADLPRLPLPWSELTSSKEVLMLSEAWRKGRAKIELLPFQSDYKNSLIKLAPSGNRLVALSAMHGTCNTFDSINEKWVSKFSPSMEAGFTCAAISSDCTVYSLSDGLSVYVNAVNSRDERLKFVSRHPGIECIAISNAGSFLAQGLKDGRIAITKLSTQEKEIDKANHSVSLKPLKMDGGPLQERMPLLTQFVQVQDNVPVSCLQFAESVSLESPWHANDAPILAAGSEGGHVQLIDVQVGIQAASLLGSCSCKVSHLCLPSKSAPYGSTVLYGSFFHRVIGHGHSNAVYVWDVATSSRIALLYPGGNVLRYGKGRHSMDASMAQNSRSYVKDPVSAVHAGAYKVAVSCGRSVTVFDARMWRFLYEFKFEPKLAGSGSPEERAAWNPHQSCEVAVSCLHFEEGRLAVALENGSIPLLSFGPGGNIQLPNMDVKFFYP